MGKLIQNILDSLKLTDEEDDFEEELEERRPRAVTQKDEPKRRSSSFARNYEEEEEERDEEPPTRRERPMRVERSVPQSSRIVPLRPASNGLEVCIMKPTRFEDSQDVCDMLKNERAIIVSLEGIDIALAQRIMDFISGAIYSLNAKIHQISNYIFCISPEKVEISGDDLSMIQQTGFEVPNLSKN